MWAPKLWASALFRRLQIPTRLGCGWNAGSYAKCVASCRRHRAPKNWSHASAPRWQHCHMGVQSLVKALTTIRFSCCSRVKQNTVLEIQSVAQIQETDDNMSFVRELWLITCIALRSFFPWTETHCRYLTACVNLLPLGMTTYVWDHNW